MKKLFIALVALFCTVMLASCGGDSYKESEYSDALTDRTLSGKGFYISTEEFVGTTSSITGMSSSSFTVENEKKQLRTVEFDAEYRDYYTCAYLDPAAIKIIDENPVVSTPGTFWSGISNRIRGYGALANTGMLDKENHPILWVEIAKSEEIPETYRGKTLVMITESRGTRITDLADGTSEMRETFYERRELYREELLPSQYTEYKSELETDAMLVYGKFDYGDAILSGSDIFNMSYYHGLDITERDGKQYVKAPDPVYNTYDFEKLERGSILLTDACDSITEGKDFYFALDDLKEIYLTTNIKPVK